MQNAKESRALNSLALHVHGHVLVDVCGRLMGDHNLVKFLHWGLAQAAASGDQLAISAAEGHMLIQKHQGDRSMTESKVK